MGLRVVSEPVPVLVTELDDETGTDHVPAQEKVVLPHYRFLPLTLRWTLMTGRWGWICARPFFERCSRR